ncbi:MAG: crcB [Frankiales bacterium]|nr:crcB [Frankiales bacterium]
MTPLLVALGAAVGAPARFAVAIWVPGRRATLLVNVLGSFVLGLLVHPSPSTSALVGTGFCGAFTTYSTFAVEAAESRSLRYVVTTVVLCLGAAALSRSFAG